MLQLLQDGYLTDGCAGNALVLCLQPNLLQCNMFTSEAIPRLVDHPVGPFSNLLNLLVLLHVLRLQTGRKSRVLRQAEVPVSSALGTATNQMLGWSPSAPVYMLSILGSPPETGVPLPNGLSGNIYPKMITSSETVVEYGGA